MHEAEYDIAPSDDLSAEQIRDLLHPELRDHLESDERLGVILHHPLVFAPFLSVMKNALEPVAAGMNIFEMINHNYQKKKSIVERALTEGDYYKYVFHHERPYHMNALQEVLFGRYHGCPAHLWPVIAAVWLQSESVREHYEDWKKLWALDYPVKHRVMTRDERRRLSGLPGEITVWRGISHPGGVAGLSWTLSSAKAEWFARRNDGTPLLASGKVEKKHVLAYFAGRRERELIIFPEHVLHVTLELLGSDDQSDQKTHRPKRGAAFCSQ